MDLAGQNQQELKRKVFFTHCKTKEDLHNWCQVFLNIDIPDSIVHDSSNISPMGFLWEIYSKALDGTDLDYTQVLTYAGRDCAKTLLASIIEVLMMFHSRRNITHLAAIEAQSDKCVEYVRNHLAQPVLADFFVGAKNKRISEVCWYERGDVFITEKEYKTLSPEEHGRYTRKTYYVKILVATMKSVNSDHCNFQVLDECEIFPSAKIIQESAGVLTSGENKELPIRLLTSTRKFNGGIVQDIIDESAETGTQVRHWNIFEVTESCPPTRHLPLEPRIPIYVNDKTLKAISEKEFEEMSTESRVDFEQKEGFAGCLSRCSLFAACSGNLATKQKSTSKFLKPIPYVQDKFKKNDVEWVKAQLLCLKPSSEGMIYARVDRERHAISPADMVRKITGREDVPDTLTKAELVSILKRQEGYFLAGMDWGFVNAYGITVAWTNGYIMLVLEGVEVSGLEMQEKLEITEKYVKPYDCQAIWADTAYPDHIKTFKRAGYKMKEWTKGAGSVLSGIEITRMKLTPTFGGEPQIYFLRDDLGCENLIKRIVSYRWKLDVNGDPTVAPMKQSSDILDAFRYMVMNCFAPKGRIITESNPQSGPQSSVQTPGDDQSNWMQKIVQERLGDYDTSAIGPMVLGKAKKHY